MKEELPLTESDFANIRKSVMTTIATQQGRRARVWRGMQLAFAALVIVVGAWWMTRTTPQEPQVETAAKATPQQPHAATQQPRNSVTEQLTTVAAATTQPRNHATPVATHFPGHHHRTKPEPVLAAASDVTPIRLELRTADPDIRIIWISNPNDSR